MTIIRGPNNLYDYFARINGRLTATQINELKPDPKEVTLETTAAGAHIPIVYGRKSVPGIISAFAVNGSGNLCVRVVWCAGEVEEVEAVFINDATPPVGVTVTSYVGTTTQTEDATMDAAITAYSDTMILSKPAGDMGLCYTVFEIPATDLDNAPRFQAIIKGKLVDDPDEVNPIYSDNPALCFGELASNPIYGLGVTVTGLDAAKDWCDEEIATGVVRSRVSLAITSSRKTEEWLDLLATYGDFLWYNDSSGGITIVPDSVVATGDYWLEETFVKDSLSIEGIANTDTPSKVTVRWTEPETTTANWEEMTTSQQLPGVDTGDVPLVETTLDLRGVWREEEAINKALSRLLRMQNRVRVSFTATDIALAYNIGDVVNVQSTERGVSILVRVDAVQLISYGRYSVTGLRYDPEHYPSELPVGTGSIPVGAITLLSGTTVPSGWQLYGAANDKFIMGAGSTYDPGDTGGTATYAAGFTGTTSTDGGHNYLNTSEFQVPLRGSGGALTTKIYSETASDRAATKGEHAHTYTVAAITPDLYRRENILIEKISSSGTEFPSSALVFGLDGLSVANLVRSTTFQNRILQAASAQANDGISSQFVEFTSDTYDDTHAHHTEESFSGVSWATGPAVFWAEPDDGGGIHSHDYTLALSRSVKRRRLALYAGTDDFTVVPGMIIFWAGTIASIPANWSLCDGTGVTPDLRDYMIEIAASGQEGTATGDNTLSYFGNGSSESHDHDGTLSVDANAVFKVAHDNQVSHTHTISDSGSWTPPYFALAVLMYDP